MYQVGPRETGKCFFCPEETEVVPFAKDGQKVKLCKKHLWEALNGGKEQSEKTEAAGVK